MQILGPKRLNRALGRNLVDKGGAIDLFSSAPLDLRFALQKTLDPRVTFTRASSATYVGSDGLVKSATTNEARFDHNPTTGESLGLLVEEARTNLLLRSEEFNDASWNSVAGARTVTANQIAAPDGTTTADLVTADGTTAAHSVSQSLTLSAVPYSYSVFAKAGTNNFLQLRFFAAFGAGFANFNLATGVVGTLSGSATSSIQAYPNGWYRCTMVFTPTAATSSVGMFIVSSASASSAEINSLSTSIYLWGAQLEAGAFPTSYISTTSATVTRAADVASITGSNFSSWYNQSEGTVFSDSDIIASQVQTQTVWQLGGGTILTSLRQPQGTSNQFRALIGGTFTASPGTGGLLSAGTSKAGVAYLGTAGRLQVASSGVDSTGSSLDANKLDIGSLNPGTSLNGTIKRLTYWPVRLANTTLQSITTP